MKRSLKRLFRRTFTLGQRFGVDILPRHFYSEIPDVGKLRKTWSWRTPYPMACVQGSDCDGQLEFARKILSEPDPGLADAFARACRENGSEGFGPMEAEFLYGYIATCRPSGIVQIGAGVSTSVILQAAERTNYRPSLCCIDPYPTAFLERLAQEGKIELIARPAEEVGTDIVSRLGSSDLLFIDSTHSLGPAGEATRIVVEWASETKSGRACPFSRHHFPIRLRPQHLGGEPVLSARDRLVAGVSLHESKISDPVLSRHAAS